MPRNQAFILSLLLHACQPDEPSATSAGSTGAATGPGTTGAPDTGGEATDTGDGVTGGATTSTSTGDSPATTTSASTSASTSSTGVASTGAIDETGTTGGGGCEYELVVDMPGDLLTMTYENSSLTVQPLQPGQSFYCMRIEFDMQTADTLAQTLMDFPGCPIFTAIAGLRGGDKKLGKLMAGALFKYYKVGCTPGPDRIEMDTFVEGVVTPGPWPIGQLYHFEITVEPFTSTVRAFQGGVQVGPDVQASIAGATVDNARDPVLELGMKQPAGDAYFPNYGGTYSNLKVWASVAP